MIKLQRERMSREGRKRSKEVNSLKAARLYALVSGCALVRMGTSMN